MACNPMQTGRPPTACLTLLPWPVWTLAAARTAERLAGATGALHGCLQATLWPAACTVEAIISLDWWEGCFACVCDTSLTPKPQAMVGPTHHAITFFFAFLLLSLEWCSGCNCPPQLLLLLLPLQLIQHPIAHWIDIIAPHQQL